MKTDMRVYMNERRHANRRMLYDLLGNKCARCKMQYDEYEFDHLDRTQKSFTIASHLDLGDTRLLEEAKKCQLLCNGCHKEKTAEETARQFHGITGYTRHKCRCDICRAAWNENVRKYRLTHARKDYKKKEKFFGAAI